MSCSVVVWASNSISSTTLTHLICIHSLLKATFACLRHQLFGYELQILQTAATQSFCHSYNCTPASLTLHLESVNSAGIRTRNVQFHNFTSATCNFKQQACSSLHLAASASEAMEDEGGGISARRSSTRIRKVAAKMGEALSSADNRTQAILARLDALENDNAAVEVVDIDDDEDASLDEEEQVFQKKHSRSAKRKTRQTKALENVKKAPRTFMELLQEANLEAIPAHVPTYLRAAVGPPSSTARRHFCSVCGYIAPYMCVQCGARFCSCRCQTIHGDTRCLKFVA